MTSHDGWGAPFHDVVAWGQIFCLRAEALGGGSPGAFPFAWLSQLGDVPRPGGPTNGAGKALIQQLKSAIPCPVGLGPSNGSAGGGWPKPNGCLARQQISQNAYFGIYPTRCHSLRLQESCRPQGRPVNMQIYHAP